MTKILADKSAIDRAIDALAREQVMAQDKDGNYTINVTPKHVKAAILELREALAAPAHDLVPRAWSTFDGEGGYTLRGYEGNENYKAKWIKREGEGRANWVEALYAHPQADGECASPQTQTLARTDSLR